ncbi:vomeronasal type-2 receptor 26-like [Lissotriton helveticus]
MSSRGTVVSEDSSPADPIDRKVDGAVKRTYAAANFSIRAAAYSSYTIQSLLKDFQSVAELLDQGEDVSSTLAMMEQQVRLLSDVSFDSLGAAASAAGSSVAVRRQLWLRSWKADAAQKNLLMKIPFSGVKLFGPPLDDMVKKTAEDCKLLAPDRTGRSRAFGSQRAFDNSRKGRAGQPFRGRLGLLNYQWLQAMVFAIEEINRNPDILPNVTLGFRIYDSCLIRQRALEGTFWVLTGMGKLAPNYRCLMNNVLAGIVGDAGSSCSIAMSRVLTLYRLPQISYFSSSPLLSDRIQFPSFFRTVPSDDFQSRGLAQLLVHFGWTWVGLVAEDNDYGQQGVQILQEEIIKAGLCVAFSESIFTSRPDKNAFHIVQVIKESTANAIVIFASDAEFTPVADEIVKQNVIDKVWIASESWSTSPLISAEKYSNIFTGTIGFAIHSEEMLGFKEHLNKVHPLQSPSDITVNIFWENAFGCKWLKEKHLSGSSKNETPECTGTEKLDHIQIGFNDVNNLRVAYNVYTAVYAIASALQDLMLCRQGQGPSHLLLPFVKKVKFHNKVGAEIFFDENGNIPAQYDIMNWQFDTMGTVKYVKVGSYESGATMEKGWSSGMDVGVKIASQANAIKSAVFLTIHDFINEVKQIKKVPISVCSPSCSPGFRKLALEGEPVCCFECIRCPQGEISNQTDSAECYKCGWDSWPNVKKDTCVAKIIEYLSYEEPLGATLMTICIFWSLFTFVILGLFKHYRNTPIVKANNRSLSYLLLLSLSLCFLCSLAFIGYPTTVKCLLRQVAFGITFAFCVSCILAKTIMVVSAFKATKPNSDLMKCIGPHFSYIVIFVLTFIQVILCAIWLFLSPPFSAYNTIIKPEMIVVECNEGSPLAFWCMLGYLGALASTSFILAFLARKLPDSFNEAQFITFSMLAFLSVWLSFIPAYLSTKGKYMVAMEIFAMLSSTFALVSCIFFPKCYIILFRPDNNSKEHLMGKKVYRAGH